MPIGRCCSPPLLWLLDREDIDAALRLVGALAIFWATHGHYSEARDWYRKVLPAAPVDTSAVRARALWGLGHLSLFSMDYDGGYGTADTMQAATLAGQLGDHLLLGRALADQGVLLAFAVPEAGIATLEQAVEAARQVDDDWTLATALTFLAFSWSFHRDRVDLAEPLLDELAGIAGRSDSPEPGTACWSGSSGHAMVAWLRPSPRWKPRWTARGSSPIPCWSPGRPPS